MAEAISWEQCREAFQQKVDVRFERSRFIIKTVSSPEELEATLRLRHQVFYQEILGADNDGLDCDIFDTICDHLIIIDTSQNNQIVGTYRLNCAQSEHGFYSETEFSMDGLKQLPEKTVELGRACVHPDYRRSPALALLWQGLSHFVDASQCRYFIGCSSIGETG